MLDRSAIPSLGVLSLACLLAFSACAKRDLDNKEEVSRSTGPLVSGLVAAYGFEEGAGTTAADASGNGRTGTLAGAEWQRGKFGDALSFNGSTDSVTALDAQALQLTTDMTLSAWVRPTAPLVGHPPLVTKGADWLPEYGLYGALDSGLPSTLVLAGGQANIVAGSAPLPVGIWTHLATTYDGSTLSFYVDGALAMSQPLADPIEVSTGPLRIGGNDVGVEYFAGLIDEVRVYDRALSPSEVASDMGSAIAAPGPELPVILGDSSILPEEDNGNGDLMEAQQAFLAEPTAIQSLSLYVTNAVGELRMGIYAADGPDGDPGTKLAETAELTPAVGWNTANVVPPVVVLQPGTYWLVYLPSDSELGIRMAGVGTYVEFPFAFGPMPTAYSTPTDRGSFHWSFYASGVPAPAASACTQNGGPLPAGTACSDGNPCNGSEACDGSGNCAAGTPVSCGALDQCHEVGVCDPNTGTCSNPTKADGSACSDGDLCTQRDVCQTGACVGTEPIACPAPGPCHAPGTCSPASGFCTNPAQPDGASCSDGNVCNGSEVCNGSGTCTNGTAPNVDDSNPCTVDACDSQVGVSHVAAATGVSCADGDHCNGEEACNATGQCVSGAAPALDDGNPCTVDSCEPTSGVRHAAAPAGTSCSDGNACNGIEACNGSAQCTASAPSALDDSNPCTLDACDPVAGITHTPVAAGLSCADEDVCNGDERCDAVGSCAAGAPPTTDDNNPCTWDTCDPLAGVAHTDIAGCGIAATSQPFETRASIMGRVVRADGTGLSDFTVVVFNDTPDSPPRTDVAATINSDGRFRIRLLSFPEGVAERSPPQQVVIRVDGAEFPSLFRKGFLRPGDVLPLGDLTVLQRDPKVTIVGPEGGTASDSLGTLELVVPAGALSQPTPIRLTPIRTRAEFPMPLPHSTLTTYGMELEPSGTELAVPATLRVKNTLNIPTTMKIPYGSVDPHFGDWEPGGQAVWDGSRFAVQVRHFSPHDCNFAPMGELVTIVDRGRDSQKSKDKDCVGSSVGYSNGSLEQRFELPMHVSSGHDYSLGLKYESSLSGSVALGTATTGAGPSPTPRMTRTMLGVSVHTECVPPGGAGACAGGAGGGGPPCVVGGSITAPFTANQRIRLFDQEASTSRDLVANTDQHEALFHYELPNDPSGAPTRSGYFPSLIRGAVTVAGSQACAVGGAGFGVAAPGPLAGGGAMPGSSARLPLEHGPMLDFPNYELVVHRRTSPLGSGWSLAELGTLYRTPDHMAADLLRGDGELESFRPYPQVSRIVNMGNTSGGCVGVDRQTGEVFVVWYPDGSIAKLDLQTGTRTAVAPNPLGSAGPINLAVTYVNGERRFLVESVSGLFEVEANGTIHELVSFGGGTRVPAVAGVGKYAYFTRDRTGLGADVQTVSRIDLTDPLRVAVTITSSSGGDLSLDPHGLVDAQNFWFIHPRGLAPAYDGGLYVADDRRHVVYHLAPDTAGEVGPNSKVTRVLGSGVDTMMVGLGRKLPALEMALRSPELLTTAPDGTLYVATARAASNIGAVLALDPIEQTAHWVAFDRDSILRNVEISVRGRSMAPLGGDRLVVPYYDSVFLLRAPFTSEFDPTRELTFSASGATVVDSTADRIEQYQWTTPAANEAQLVAEQLRSGEPIRTIVYKDADRVDYIQDPAGGRVAFGYGASGRLETITDAAGRSTHFTVDAPGNLKEVLYPTGEALRFDYEDFRLTSVTHPNSEVSHYTYAPDGTLRSAQRPGGGTTQIHAAMSVGPQYDSAGKLFYEASLTDDRGVEHAIQVNAAGAVTSDRFAADGRAYDVENVYASQLVGPSLYESLSNRLLRISTTLVNGLQVTPSARFNPAGQLVDLQSSSTIVAAEYDSLKRLSKLDWGVTGVDWNSTYDIAGHLTKVADQYYYGGETGRRTEFGGFRASDGQPTSVTQHGVTTTLGYDSRGLVNSAVDSVGRTLSVTHDAAGNPTAVNDGATTVQYGYDSGGRLTSITDAESNITQLGYQSAGCACSNGDRLTSVVTPDLGPNERWSFDYDADGNLKTLTTPLGEHEQYAFNAQGDLAALADRNGRSTTFNYDQLGRHSSTTDALGRVGTFVYSTPTATAWSGPTLYARSGDSTAAPTSLSAALSDGQYQVGVNGLRSAGAQSHVSLYRDATFQLAYWNDSDVLGRLRERTDRTTLPFDSTAAGPSSGPLEDVFNDYGSYGSPWPLPLNRSVPDAANRTWTATIGRNPDFDITSIDRFLGLPSAAVAYIDNLTIGRDVAGRVTSSTTRAVVETGFRTIAASTIGYKPNGQLDSVSVNTAGYSRSYDGAACYCATGCTYRACSQNTDDCTSKNGTVPVGHCLSFPVNSASVTQRFQYDARGLMSTRSVTARETITIGDFQYTYDQVGRNTVLVYPDGHTRRQTFDAIGRLTSRCYAYSDGSPEHCYTAEYDAVGNPTTLRDPDMRQEITYDALDRVTEVRRYVPPTATQPAYVETYAYNALGGFSIYDGVALDDRRPRLAGGGTASAGIPATLGGQPVGLDAGGRISSLNGNTFQYYKLNHRLQAISSATQKDSYSYDSLERLAQIESGAPDGSLPITERLFIYSGLDDSATAIATAVKQAPTPSSEPAPDPPNPQTGERFIYDGLDHPLALPDPYPAGLPVPYNRTVYYEIDAIGNVRHLHGTAGGIDARDLGGYTYTAFGKTIPPTQPGGLSGPEKSQSLRWQGRPQVGPNLYDFRARVWSAELGAFLQPDEYGFLTPSGTLWSWPGQNPYRWRDPSGRFLDGAAAAAADAAAEAALAAASAGAAGTVATALAGVAAVGFVGYAAYDIYNQINDFKHPIITHADPSKSAAAGKEPCPETGDGGGKARVPPSAAAAADEAPLPRFNGPKPKYSINDAHVPGQGLRPGKTPLPVDAKEVFARAVPNDPADPTAWFGRNSSGQVYRFSLSNDGTAHFSGIHGVGVGTRNITPYALERLGVR